VATRRRLPAPAGTGADGSAVASLRAITDHEVWRALRHQGATLEAAVDEASAAVERWLDGH